MSRLRLIFLPAIAFPIVAEAQSAGSAHPISSLKWLAGEWQQQVSMGISYEKWKIANDSLMTGSSGLIDGKDTVEEESIKLTSARDTTWYIPTVHNQNSGLPVPFRLIFSSADSFVFSAPAHDFPQYISYVRKSDTQLIARIWGMANGEKREIKFPMKKVK